MLWERRVKYVNGMYLWFRYKETFCFVDGLRRFEYVTLIVLVNFVYDPSYMGILCVFQGVTDDAIQ